jgi:hypothetical protein
MAASEDRSPTNIVAGAIVAAKEERENAERELEGLPPWRVLRRAELERRIARAREREETLLAELGGSRHGR